MGDVAIKFENVSKQYRLGLVSTRTLSHDLKRWWITNVLGKEDPYLTIGETNDRSTKGESEYIWALKDIDFEVKKGEVLGIIGKNGAGKSTLLKILSRVTSPTTGYIHADGRIASLLEVGTGFHPELTGRENIYMNGAIMGMTNAEISRKMDEIVDFSGCERYIDTPVKRYSSGMMVRLGFAIAAHLEPEILVVDEVLAVGDAEFQKKAIGKMQDISKGGGRTVLFVSHNMGAVKNLCNKGIVLRNGKTEFLGNIDDAIVNYLSDRIEFDSDLTHSKDRYGNGKIIVNKISIFDEYDNELTEILAGQKIKIRLWFNRNSNENISVIPSIGFVNQFDQIIFSHHSRLVGMVFNNLGKSGFFEFEIESLAIVPGNYKIAYSLISNGVFIDSIDVAKKIQIISSNFYGYGEMLPATHTLILLNGKWKMYDEDKS